MNGAPGVRPALARADHVELVLRNLLSNAEKYSAPDVAIEIALRSTETEVTITVRDRGIGIPPDEITSVFSTFYRSPRAAHQQGFGIGLAVCKRLIEAQGGRVWAEPRAGGGTEFSFTLPVAEEVQPGT